MIEWIQTIDGVMSLSFGGISLVAIIGVVFTTIKQISNAKDIKGIISALTDAKETIAEERKEKEEYKKRNTVLEAEKRIEAEKSDYLIKAISLIIGASNGITSVDKLELIKDGHKLAETIKKEVAKTAEQIVEEVVETAVESLETISDTATKSTLSILDKYIKK